ncbi:MAG TPA: hypothetical protein VIK04_19825 [Solirubrobacteraceae bacterium]
MSARIVARRWALALRLIVVAFVWSVGLIVTGLFIPTYPSDTASPVTGVTLTSSTLLQSKGAWAMVLVTLPAIGAVAVLVLLRARRYDGGEWRLRVAWAMVTAVTLESLLGILSVGAYMLPVPVLLALSLRLVSAEGVGAPPKAELVRD